MRIGLGYDIHRFSEGRLLVLGGVPIPHPVGLMGHSDADVLTHAVCDALLGAAGVGDIGTHFPDSDPKYKGISSLLLLREVGKKVAAEGFRLVNLDAVLLAEAPKIAPFRLEMQKNMADALGVEIGRVHVKATTCEGIGAIGRREGIAAQCVALIEELKG